MKNRKQWNFWLGMLTTILISSCGTSLSSNLINKYGLVANDLQRIQYYLSGDLILSRETTEAISKGTTGGTVKQVKGLFVEEIKIPRGTPGVAIKVGEGGAPDLYVSFVPGDDNNTIVFSPCDEEGSYCFREKIIEYAGKTWNTNRSSDDKIYLHIKTDEIIKTRKQENVLSGRKVSDVPETAPPVAPVTKTTAPDTRKPGSTQEGVPVAPTSTTPANP